jgi:microsomal dipeptidase-like Zn-dependent dipeptidase
MSPPIFGKYFPRPAIVQYTAAPPFLTSYRAILAEVLKTIACFESQPDVLVVKTAADLKLPHKIKVILGLQQPPFDANAEQLSELYRLGIRLTTLAYKDDESPYGGGFLSAKSLTNAGGKFINSAVEAGIWIDLSHAGHQTARDAVKQCAENRDARIVASHTGCFGVYDYPRNLPDDVLENIALQGGVVGLYTLSFGLSPTDDSLSPFRDHLKHLIKVCGYASVTLGTDGVYEELNVKEAQGQFQLMQGKFDPDGRMRSRFPVECLRLNVADKSPILRVTIENMGMRFQDFNAIMFENGLSFLNRNL